MFIRSFQNTTQYASRLHTVLFCSFFLSFFFVVLTSRGTVEESDLSSGTHSHVRASSLGGLNGEASASELSLCQESCVHAYNVGLEWSVRLTSCSGSLRRCVLCVRLLLPLALSRSDSSLRSFVRSLSSLSLSLALMFFFQNTFPFLFSWCVESK